MFNNSGLIRRQCCVVLKRCSSGPQIVTSIANQGKTTEQAIKEFELVVVKEEDLEGVTGSVPGNRTDIDRIIARKRHLNDFKVLLIQDTSRFTRAGQGHGQKLIYELRSVGILVYFVAEDLLINDEMSEMYASFLFSAARHTVKQIAYAATSGSTNSFSAGRSPHSRRPPFGLDRMYSDNGIDRHIIRNLPDGTQQQLHPTTFELIRTFAKNEKKGIPNHYIKQKSEVVRLVPGNPLHIAVVMLIFHLHDVDGWSYHQIAKHLNDTSTPSPLGKEWWTDTVRNILLNPIYFGLGIRGRGKKGIYYVAAEGQPMPSGVTIEELANNKSVKYVLRPREEWLSQVQSHLEEFLPEQVRSIARRRIENHLEAIAHGKPKKANKDPHRDHFYLLKGILRSKQGNYPMTGRVGGKNNDVRSYAVSRAEKAPKSNNILARRVPAQPLENAVVGLVREVVRSIPDLNNILKKLILQNMKAVIEDIEKPEQIKKEIQRKQKQLALLTDDVQLDDDDVLIRKINSVKADIRALNQRLNQVPQNRQMGKTDVDAIAAKFAEEIMESAEALGDLHNQHGYRLLELLISRMEVDLETLEVEIDFSFPSWMGSAMLEAGPVGLDELSAYKSVNEAHPENPWILGIYSCYSPSKPACYTCNRRLAA